MRRQPELERCFAASHDALEGDLHGFRYAAKFQDRGNRANDDKGIFGTVQELTYVLNPSTNVYFNLLHNELKAGLPGFATRPVLDDRANSRFRQGIIGGRHRLGKQAHLWAGYLDIHSTMTALIPDAIIHFALQRRLRLSTCRKALRKTESIAREVRLDYPSHLAARYAWRFFFRRGAVANEPKHHAIAQQCVRSARRPGHLALTLVDTDLVYLQLAQRFGQRFSFTGQLRYHAENNQHHFALYFAVAELAGFQLRAGRSSESKLLPSLVANYQLNRKTQLRLLAAKRSTDVLSSFSRR